MLNSKALTSAVVDEQTVARVVSLGYDLDHLLGEDRCDDTGAWVEL